MENEISSRLRSQADRIERIMNLAKEKNYRFTEDDDIVISNLESVIIDYNEILDQEN